MGASDVADQKPPSQEDASKLDPSALTASLSHRKCNLSRRMLMREPGGHTARNEDNRWVVVKVLGGLIVRNVPLTAV